MEHEQRMIGEKKHFFGSKTNGILLLILIGLIVVTIVIMMTGTEKYVSMFGNKKEQTNVQSQDGEMYEGENVSFSVSKEDAGRFPGFSINTNNGYALKKVTKDGCGSDCPTAPYFLGVSIWKEGTNEDVGSIYYDTGEECSGVRTRNNVSYLGEETINMITYKKFGKAKRLPDYYCVKTKEEGTYLVISASTEGTVPALVDLGTLQFK